MKVIAVSILSFILIVAASGIGIAKAHIKSRPTATQSLVSVSAAGPLSRPSNTGRHTRGPFRRFGESLKQLGPFSFETCLLRAEQPARVQQRD